MTKIAIALVLVAVLAGGYLYYPRGSVDETLAASLAVLSTPIEAQRGVSPFAPALDGELMANGDVVRSQQDGRAVLTFFDGSTLTIDPGAIVRVLTLNHIAPDGIQVIIDQTLGRTWASVAKLKTPDSKFEIRTPTAVAAVRGTAFETNVVQQPDGTIAVTFKTEDGDVLVTGNAGGTTDVPANFQVTVVQNQPAPPQAQPRPPGPRLDFASFGAFSFAVIGPTGAGCGTLGTRQEMPGCVVRGNSASIRDPVPGHYTLMLSVGGATLNPSFRMEALRGDQSEVARTVPMALAFSENWRTGFTYAATTPLTLTDLEPRVRITSVCGAEATGRVFSTGEVAERFSQLATFTTANKNALVAIVLTDAELAQDATSRIPTDGPVTVRDLKVSIDGSGIHLKAQVQASVLSLTASGDVIAGPVNGKLVLRLRDLSAGVLPSAALEQIQVQVERGLAPVSDSFPFVVRQVALRPGCLAVIGVTPP